MRLVTGVIGWVVTLAIVGLPIALDVVGVISLPLWLTLVVGLGMLLWAVLDVILIPRRIRAIGYHERPDDLLIRRGLLFQKLVAVPYGRLQYVDIEAGPVMRRFQLCTLQLKTASASTDAVIPGVHRDEGARLREQLPARGQARLAGL